MNSQELKVNRITDERSFNNFYLKYHRYVYGVAYQFTGCVGAAKDIKQQVFMRIWVNRHKIDPLRDVLSYVFICTRNEALNMREIRKRHDEGLRNYYSDPSRIYTDLMCEIETRQIYESVRRAAMKQLPEECKKVYQLMIEEDNDYLDVAKALKVSPSTVKNQKINARRKLKKFIGSEVVYSFNN